MRWRVTGARLPPSIVRASVGTGGALYKLANADTTGHQTALPGAARFRSVPDLSGTPAAWNGMERGVPPNGGEAQEHLGAMVELAGRWNQVR